jgi:small subunit ribosomal protein S16
MLTLRLSRAGTKKRPVYHLVAADKRARRDGRFVENLGYFIPNRDVLVLKQDRIAYWLSVGAQTTSTAKQLIRKARSQGNVEPTAKPAYEPPVVKPVVPKVEVKAEAPAKPAEVKAEEAKAPEAKPAEQA